MKKILIEIILSNQCNKRCEYCDLNFRNNEISDGNIQKLLVFLGQNKIDFSLNFFGGEPLLAFDKLQKIVNFIPKSVKKLSVGTNGKLLSKEKIEFLKKKNFSIYLSVDNIDNGKFIDLDLISYYSENIFINFILDPNYICFEKSKQLFDDLLKKGFRKFNLMPVYTTKKWNKKSFIELKKISDYLDYFDDLIICKYNYFNGISPDLQFIFDTDGYFYQDLDSLLWLQKQYKIVSNFYKNLIHNNTQLAHINEVSSIEELIEKYNIKLILKYVIGIPKVLGLTKTNNIIFKIFSGK